jgi:hypothetical protein
VNLARLVETWDLVVEAFLEGHVALPPPLDRWIKAYQARGVGEVDARAFPEPYVGPLDAEVRAVFLALNPGRAAPEFQYRDGIFAEEIRGLGSYRRWAATWPYLRDPWDRLKGRNRHHRGRLAFLRRWFGDECLGGEHMAAFELYPWHSTRVTASIRPDPGIVRELVWEPIAELGAPVFAFGAPWFPVLEALDVEVTARLGVEGVPYPTRVPSRSVLVGRVPGGGWVIAEKHLGSAGPPSRAEVELLRDQVQPLLE